MHRPPGHNPGLRSPGAGPLAHGDKALLAASGEGPEPPPPLGLGGFFRVSQPSMGTGWGPHTELASISTASSELPASTPMSIPTQGVTQPRDFERLDVGPFPKSERKGVARRS